MNKIIGETILEASQDLIKILEDRIIENTGVTIEMKITGRDRGGSRSRERSFSRNNNIRRRNHKSIEQ